LQKAKSGSKNYEVIDGIIMNIFNDDEEDVSPTGDWDTWIGGEYVSESEEDPEERRRRQEEDDELFGVNDDSIPLNTDALTRPSLVDDLFVDPGILKSGSGESPFGPLIFEDSAAGPGDVAAHKSSFDVPHSDLFDAATADPQLMNFG
jgi:hypothetical protein